VPSKSIVPAAGRTKRLIALKAVVLPAPLGPISAQISPWRTPKLTSSSAVTPPNRTVRPSTCSNWEPVRLPSNCALG
jgi:hypothetical protein